MIEEFPVQHDETAVLQLSILHVMNTHTDIHTNMQKGAHRNHNGIFTSNELNLVFLGFFGIANIYIFEVCYL